MGNICIIPARGGSKRIPRKNIKNFCGKPIIAYSIEAALKSGVFNEVMVSTDDNEIVEIAKRYGANVPFLRSVETSGDYASTEEVLVEVLAEYKKQGREFDNICCLYPCAPFVSMEIIISSFEKLSEKDVNSVMPVCRFPVPVEWAIDISTNEIRFKNREATLMRSQDLQPHYFDAGMFYCVKAEKMLSEQSLTPGKAVPVVVNENEVQDIDTIEDWKMAEMKYKILNGEF